MIKLLFLWFSLSLAFAQTNVTVATFDSGFGGYFTAKEIEKTNFEFQKEFKADFRISHYGDTANAPYGEKTPEKIAELSALGISKAFDDGAQYVFIACNTASTQFDAIKSILNQKNPGRGDRIISIIESSVVELKRLIDEKLVKNQTVQVAILATPATIKAQSYLKALSESYEVKATSQELKSFTQERWYKKKGDKIDSFLLESVLRLKNGKIISISQIGPANWVDMVEHGASEVDKTKIIARDLKLLAPKRHWDVVGEFCTHFPALDKIIKDEAHELKLASATTNYIKQGPIMALVYKKMMATNLQKNMKGSNSVHHRAKIFISGDNMEETLSLAKSIFPNDPVPEIEKKSFR